MADLKNPGILRFFTELRDGGGGGAYIEFPFDAEELFGTKARVPVRVTVDGAPYTGSLMRYRGVRMVGIPKAVRDASSVSIGDTVEIVLELDETSRTVEAPPELAEELARDPEAAAGWDKLSFTHKREHAQAISEAKRSGTRAKRVAAALEAARKRGA